MAEQNKGGRPPVGGPQGSAQITFTVPKYAADRAEKIAAEGGVTKASVQREFYMGGMEAASHAADREQTPEFVRPAAEIIARWVGQPDDVLERRKRFFAWHHVSDHPVNGMNVILRAVGELTVAGVTDVPAMPPVLLERLTATNGWRVRTILALTVVQVCQELGVTVHVDGAKDGLPDMEEDVEVALAAAAEEGEDDGTA